MCFFFILCVFDGLRGSKYETIVCSHACHQNLWMYTFIVCFWTSEKLKTVLRDAPLIFIGRRGSKPLFYLPFFILAKTIWKNTVFNFRWARSRKRQQNRFERRTFFSKKTPGVFERPLSSHMISLAGVGDNNGPLVFASVKPMVCKRAPYDAPYPDLLRPHMSLK